MSLRERVRRVLQKRFSQRRETGARACVRVRVRGRVRVRDRVRVS